MIGRTLAHYRILDKLGEGAMGEVWRAVDTALDREVAIKLLPEAFASDPERLARFEREAKLLASLNHPGIATIHGLHETDAPNGSGTAVRFLAMELVPGEDLAQRLSRGPIPIDEALGIARQVAGAVGAAHASGVVHRDLKPANVRITPEGKIKVLDFGLAKGVEPGTLSDADPATMPTLTSAGTAAGVLLGTAAYMSPEQARGRATDRRTDLWAFGCVLYEMLTGKPTFEGETVSDTLAAVLRAEPDWDALPAGTPPSIRRLLRRCLEKNPDRRLHDIADARIEIDDASSSETESVPPGAGPATRRASRLPWVVATFLAVVAFAAIGVALERSSEGRGEPLHISVTLPRDLELMGSSSGEMIVAISPDGRQLAFVAREEDTIRLYLRALDSTDVVAIPETEGAATPFFSPDGRWVAFFANGKLKKVSVQGGTPVDLCDAPSRRGGVWASDDTIIFAPTFNSGLARVPAAGGEPEFITTPDREKNERTHRWPEILPGGKAAVFTIGTVDNPGYYDDATIATVDLESGKTRTLIEGGSIARYAPTGHLIYSREGSLLAVPFDADRQEVTGPPAVVLDGVAGEITSGAVHFGISGDGTLIYMPAGKQTQERTLVWVDRDGRAEPLVETRRPYLGPKISPDGRRVAIGIGPGPGEGDIWIYGFEEERLTRLTFENSALGPVWAPDGKHVAYGITRGGDEGVAWRAADGSTAEEQISRDSGQYAAIPEAWVPGTDTIVYSRSGGRGGADVMTITLDDPEPKPLLDGPFREGGATFSPDGKWMAYATDDTGQFEIFVQPFPGLGGKWQLTTEGGKGPIWSRDGSEIFYTDGNKMMVVPVELEPTFSPGTPRKLFEYGFERSEGPLADYDVAPDRRRFLMVERPAADPVPRRIDLITDFNALLPE